MGWHAADRFAGMDHSAMKKLFFILLLALSVPAFAKSTHVSLPGYLSGTYKSATAEVVNGAFTMAPAISVAGRSVTVPATARLAASAGQFAVGAIRLNPTALVVGAVLPYLIGKGIEYANGNFELYESPELPSTSDVIYSGLCVYATGSCNSSGLSGITCTSRQDCVQKVWAARGSYKTATTQADPYVCSIPANVGWCVNVNPQVMGSNQVLGRIRTSNTNGEVYATISSGNICSQPGYTLVSDKCVLTNPQNLPVPESKWNEVIAEPLPDAVVQQLSRSDVALPVEAPTFSPVDAPLGEPRLDPITGRMVQDRVRITQPNSASTLADVVPYTIDAGNVPQQTAAPEAATTKLETGEAPDSKTDCDKYPNSVACLDASDIPSNENLSTENRPFAVTPVSIGGAGTCRADFRIASSHGTFYIKTQPLCDAAGWLKPVILALAYLAAAKIISASVREG